MQIILSFVLAMFTVLHISAAATVQHNAILQRLEPFYDPPAGYESTAPGSILRQRRIAAGFAGVLPIPVEAYQLLYRTTSFNGSAIATVTTIFKPALAKKDRFIAYSSAYDSSAAKCNPSYNYQLGRYPTEILSTGEVPLIEAYLLSGYIVSSPDYWGTDPAFSAGRLGGMLTLDSMRAVSNFHQSLDLVKSPMIVGMGYSGGAISTGWAASLQSAYAPELPLKGWVMGGTPANYNLLTRLDNSLFSGLLLGAIAGLLKPIAYGAEAKSFVDALATPFGRKALKDGETECAATNALKYPEIEIFSTKFQKMGKDLLTTHLFARIFRENSMGLVKSETPIAPVMLYHGSTDEIIPYPGAIELQSSWCKDGAVVDFVTYTSGGHFTTLLIAVIDVMKFVDRAFQGSTSKTCTLETKHDRTLDPVALGANLEPTLTQLLDNLLKLGKSDSDIVRKLLNLNVTNNKR